MRLLFVTLLLGLATACGPARAHEAAPRPPAVAAVPTPAWTDAVPAGTTQVVRTVPSHAFCSRPWCAVTQAWERQGDDWRLVRQLASTIGVRGWGKLHENDDRTPVGVFGIVATFSTGPNPGRMPWRHRLPTSTVSDAPGASYNTWTEQPGRRDGARATMRYGIVTDYNHLRMRPGTGPAPVPGKGTGIFIHTSRPGHPLEPTNGCVRVARPPELRWLLGWLEPGARPRVLLDV